MSIHVKIEKQLQRLMWTVEELREEHVQIVTSVLNYIQTQ